MTPTKYLHPATADEQVCFASVANVAEGLARKQYSSRELTETFLARIDRLNPDLGAYVAILHDRARSAADASDQRRHHGETRGPFDGIPVSVKDLAPMKGAPFTAGLRPLKDQLGPVDALHVRRFADAGAVILGLTNTPEMGHKATTDNMLFGPTRNPHDTVYNAGGSSGGAAASVAAGLAVVAQGTDGGGSVRIPAAMCGTIGTIGTAGAWPDDTRPDAFAFSSPFIRIGALGRTVADTRAVTALLARHSLRDPLSAPYPADPSPPTPSRIVYDPHFGDFPVDPEILEITHRAVDLIAARHHVDPTTVALPHHGDTARVWCHQIAVLNAFLAEQFAHGGVDLLGAHRDDIPDELAASIETGRRLTALDERRDNLVRTAVFDAIEDAFEDADVIITPTLAVAEIPNADDGCTVGPSTVDGRPVDPTIGWCLTYPINLSGHPAISIPIGFTRRGLPVGLQLIGRRWADEGLQRLAETLSTALAVPTHYSATRR